MKKLTLIASASLLLAIHSSGRADTVILRFNELPANTPAHSQSIQGVTFDFRVGGVPSTGALYNAGAAGLQRFVQCPCLEGDATGTLTLNFAVATPVLQFVIARFTLVGHLT